MPEILAIPATLELILWFVVVGMQAFAFGDAAMRPTQAFPAVDKQTKVFWLIILGLALVISLIFMGRVIGLLNLLGVIAAAIYLAGVRPAVKEIGGQRRNEGPYGPW